MKYFSLSLLLATVAVTIACGDTHTTTSVPSFAARNGSTNTATLNSVNLTTKKATALAIPIPASGVDYVTLSNDAKTAAYCKTSGSNTDIFLMTSSGTEKQLTTNADVCQPQFSADGKTLIAVHPWSAGPPNSVVSIPVATGTPKTLVSTPGSTFTYWNPSFSPDGKSFLFFYGDPVTSANSGLYVMSATGTTPTQVHSQTETWAPAAFSADGTLIYLSTTGSPRQINSIKLDGSGLTPLTTSATDSLCPRLFGASILYSVWNTPNNRFDLYSMGKTGANPTLLASDATNYNESDDRCWEQY